MDEKIEQIIPATGFKGYFFKMQNVRDGVHVYTEEVVAWALIRNIGGDTQEIRALFSGKDGALVLPGELDDALWCVDHKFAPEEKHTDDIRKFLECQKKQP